MFVLYTTALTLAEKLKDITSISYYGPSECENLTPCYFWQPFTIKRTTLIFMVTGVRTIHKMSSVGCKWGFTSHLGTIVWLCNRLVLLTWQKHKGWTNNLFYCQWDAIHQHRKNIESNKPEYRHECMAGLHHNIVNDCEFKGSLAVQYCFVTGTGSCVNDLFKNKYFVDASHGVLILFCLVIWSTWTPQCWVRILFDTRVKSLIMQPCQRLALVSFFLV